MKRKTDDDEVGPVRKKCLKEIPNPFGRNINPYSVNEPMTKGDTLLYNSIKNNIHQNGGYYEKVEYLVEVMGADINKGKGDKSPLYKAIFEGKLHTDFEKIAIFFIEKGARNDYVNNLTPLHLAAMCCYVSVLEAFARNDYDFTLKAGLARDATVINLILGSKLSEKNIFEALASIPTTQLLSLWKETIIDIQHLNQDEVRIINSFIELNKLTPLLEEDILKEKDSTQLLQDLSNNGSDLQSNHNFTKEKPEEGHTENTSLIETKSVLDDGTNVQSDEFQTSLIGEEG